MVELGYSEKYYLHENEVLITKLLGVLKWLRK